MPDISSRKTIGSYENFPLSKAVKAGGLIFCSGQVPMTDDGRPLGGSIAEQTDFVLKALADTLAAGGSSLADVVKVNVILAEPGDFPEFNRVYRQYFPVDPPARTTICATLLIDARVEIELIAVAPDDKARTTSE